MNQLLNYSITVVLAPFTTNLIQQALYEYKWERCKRNAIDKYRAVFNRYQLQPRIPDCCAFFIEKISFVSLSGFPLQRFSFSYTLIQLRAQHIQAHDCQFCLWIKTLQSPISEFIEVSRETVGKKVGFRITLFSLSEWDFSYVWWKVKKWIGKK